MTQPERWAAVPGYEGWYEVSDLGRVRSVTRTVRTSRGVRTYQGRILKRWVNARGYASVTLAKRGECKDWFVHRLVLQAFVGEAPAGTECCHGNDIRDDNRLVNLRWDTHLANVREAVERGRTRNKPQITHCKRGHKFDPENTYVDRRGCRICKTCNVMRGRRRRLALRGLAA